MPACLIPVPMEVPVPLWPIISPANASQASLDRSVRLTSTSVTFQDSASTVAPASTYRGPTSASAPRVLPASTATAPTCLVRPPPASMEAPAGRPVTSLSSATAFQVRSPPSVLGLEDVPAAQKEGGGGCGSVAPPKSVLPKQEKRGSEKWVPKWVAGEGGVLWAPCGT